MNRKITKYRILTIVFLILSVLPRVFFYQEYLSLKDYYIKNFGELNMYYEDDLNLFWIFATEISIIYYPVIAILFFLLKSIITKRQIKI